MNSYRMFSYRVGPYTDIVNCHIPHYYRREDGHDEKKICHNIVTAVESQLCDLSVTQHLALQENKLLHFYSYPREFLPPNANTIQACRKTELFLFSEKTFVEELVKPLSELLTGFPTNMLLTLPGLMVRMQSPRFEKHLQHCADALLEMIANPDQNDPIFEFNILAQCGPKKARIDITSTNRALPGDPYNDYYTLVPTLTNFFSVIRDNDHNDVAVRTYSNKIEFEEELDVRGVEKAYNLKEGSGKEVISFRTMIGA
jgi:hypothetical protein